MIARSIILSPKRMLAVVFLPLALLTFSGTPTPELRASSTPVASAFDGHKAGNLAWVQSEAFVANYGQWDARAQFFASAPGVNFWLTETGVVYDFFTLENASPLGAPDTSDARTRQQLKRRGHVVRMEFAGGTPSSIRGGGLLQGNFNYFLGNDSSKWTTHVPRFAEALSEQVYEGVAARWYFDRGMPRYDLIVAPGSDPGKVKLMFTGATSLTADGDSLTLGTSVGDVSHTRLFAYQRINGAVNQIACSFRVEGSIARFDVGAYDRNRPLIIDPLVYGTFIGANEDDYANCVALDHAGRAFIAGSTVSPAFPVTVGAYDSSQNGNIDTVLAKLSADGANLMFATFMGGSNEDRGYAVALDDFTNPVLLTETNSGNFPTTASAADPTHNGAMDLAVSKFSPDGGTLFFSTFVGGSSGDNPSGLVLTNSGQPIVSGQTVSADYPTTAGAYDTTKNPNLDAFVTKLSANGKSIVYSTFLGTGGTDTSRSLALDSSDNAVVIGFTDSSLFPTVAGSYDTTFNGDLDCFVLKLSVDGSSLIWSTFLGGGFGDHPYDVALDQANNVLVSGVTRPPGSGAAFPVTPGAYDTSYNGGEDAFIAKLSANGKTLLNSTYIGGGGDEVPMSLEVDSLGYVVVTGFCTSGDYPTTPLAFATTRAGGQWEGFVSRLSPNLSALPYSTFLGGSQDERIFSVDLDSAGDAVVTGFGHSSDFPTTAGAYDPTFNSTGGGINDLFVTKLAIATPVGMPDAYGINARGTLSIDAPGVLSNDLNGPTQAITVDTPDHAAAFELAADGSFTYTPSANFTGIDSFKYRASNGVALSAATTVTINVRSVLDFVHVAVSPIPGGSNVTGTVAITTPAKGAGVKVYFTPSASCVQSGYTLTIPAGEKSKGFSIPTTAPASTVSSFITCTLNNGSLVPKNDSVTIAPLPRAVADSYGVDANKTLLVAAPGILANDTDVLGGKAVLVASPIHAKSFSMSGNGAFSYTPKVGFIGTDSFSYKCKNAGGTGTVIASVTINVRAVLLSITGVNNPVMGGNPFTGTVNIVGAAPSGGVTVQFEDTLDALKSENYSIVIPQGATKAQFSIPTVAVTQTSDGILKAKLPNGSTVAVTKAVKIVP